MESSLLFVCRETNERDRLALGVMMVSSVEGSYSTSSTANAVQERENTIARANNTDSIFFMEHFGVKLVMNWYSAIFASIVVAFPLMYRTARGAFESFDETLAWSAQTLGLSNTWIFWRVRMPCCRQGILAGTVLAFARALGEYGATSMIAGYTPGKTATIATTVYQLWRTNDEAGAMQWVLVDIVISAVVLLAVNLLERRQKQGGKRA